MFDVNIKIITELKNFLNICVSEPAILNEFRTSKKDFTRDRKLSFPRLILFITKLCKKTLSLELDTFLECEMKLAQGACSVSAFSQQRHKLKSFFLKYGTRFFAKVFIIMDKSK